MKGDGSMILIIDNTLTALDEILPSKEDLVRFCELLFVIGVDIVELSFKAYEKMGQLPEDGKFILNIDFVEEMDLYPGFFRYICHQEQSLEKLIYEIQLNDTREIVKLRAIDSCKELRIVGLDDLMCEPYVRIMNEIIKTLPNSKINFCPENTFGCASALAVQWAMDTGNSVTTSFAGCKNNAATEQVIMALRLSIRHKPNRDLSVLPILTKLFEKITNITVGNKKPIIGKNIFKVEAGIHADGIRKNPATYEAYEPQCVGAKSEIVIGKHSGIRAIEYKLVELGICESMDLIVEKLLHMVKETCTESRTSLNDDEFERLAIEVIANERKQIHC
jgi:homocitrate synthase NifV